MTGPSVESAGPCGRYARIASVNAAPWNPYLSLLYDSLAATGIAHERVPRLSLRWLLAQRRRIGFVHVHWPESLYRYSRGPRPLRTALSCVKLAALAWRLAAARVLGYRLVWTIHQVYPHESMSPRRDRLAALLLARMAHVLLAHDRATAEFAERELAPRARVEVVPHGSYVGVYPGGRSRAEVRAGLRISADAFVFLAFGELRAYKGVDLLLEAWSAAQLPTAALVIAGNAKNADLARSIRAAAEDDRRIVPLLGFVPREEVAELYGAADAAIIARADGGTSGALILALSLGVPAVYPRSTAYAEVVAGRRLGWSFTPGDAAALRDVLERAAASAATAGELGREARARADELSWDAIAGNLRAMLAAAAERR